MPDLPEGPGRGGRGTETLNSEAGIHSSSSSCMWGSLAWAGVLGRGHSPDWPTVVTGSGLPGTQGPKSSGEDWGRQGRGCGVGLTWEHTSVLGVGSSWR